MDCDIVMIKAKLKKLNFEYSDFFEIKDLHYNIDVESLQEYKRFKTSVEIINALKTNKYNIKSRLKNVLINKMRYKNYEYNYNKIINEINSQYEMKEISIIKKWLLLLYCYIFKLRPRCNIQIRITVEYTSPAGRNHYEKNYILNYENITDIAEKNGLFSEVNSQSLNSRIYKRCSKCGHIIDQDDKTCFYCNQSKISQYNKKYQEEIIELMNLLVKYYNSKILLGMSTSDEKVKVIDNGNDDLKINNEKNIIKKVNQDGMQKNNEITYQEELDYINKSNLVLYNEIENIKLDNGMHINEDFSSYIDSVSTKSKYYHSKTEKILKSYFEKKYLNKEIYNYKIIGAYADWFPSTARIARIKYIYFSCKCKKCGRIINQISDDFLENPIICKCNSNKSEIEKVDLQWEKNILPYVKRVYDAFSLSSMQANDKNYYDIYISDCFTFYYKKNNEIRRAGFSSIKKYSAERNYIVGDIKILFNDEYITFSNVYYNLGIYYDYGYIYTRETYNALNPMLYYYDGEKHYDVKNFKNDNCFFEGKTVSFMLIYFENTYESEQGRNDIFKINIYNDNKLVFQKDNIIDLNKQYCLEKNCIIFELNTKKGNEYYQVFINEKKIDVYDINYKNSEFYKTNVNIDINESAIDTNIKSIIQKYNKYDIEKYRKIYIHKTAHEAGWVLYEYLKDEDNFEILKNEFEDDKNINYCVVISRDDKDKNDFINYIIEKSRDHHSYQCNIYEHSINSLCHILLEKKDNRDKVISAIRDNNILKINDVEKRDYIIMRLTCCPPFGYKDYENDEIIKHYSYYKEIINKLKNKYNTDDFGLILILLVKYGENVVFNFPDHYIKNHHKNVENDEKLYSRLLSNSGFKETKWKSEYNLYLLVKCYFNDAIFQYKFRELGNQSLDIYIPSLKIGIEYQGQQHYESVEKFGGEEKLKTQQLLDINKKKICTQNDIILIEWNYEDKINKINLDMYLSDYKEQLKDKYKFTLINK